MKNIAFLVLAAIPSLCLSQTDFIVYKVEGSPYLEIGSTRRPLKTGQQLKASGTVVTGQSGSVSLVCKSYRLLQVKSASRAYLPTEAARCTAATEGFATLYFRYFWESVTKKHPSPEKERRKFMGNIAGVVRGQCPMFGFRTDTINHFQGDFTLSCTPSDPPNRNGLAIALFQDRSSKSPLRTFVTPGESIDLSSLIQGLQTGEAVQWSAAYGNDSTCSRNYLRLWKEDEFKELCNGYLSRFDPASTTEAERCHILAFFLERKRFYADALRYYRMAVEKEPGNRQYERSLAEFSKTYR